MSTAPPRPRVLLVDDNHGFRLELRLLLEDCGIEVVAEGENGQEAVELAAANADAYLVKGCSALAVLDHRAGGPGDPLERRSLF